MRKSNGHLSNKNVLSNFLKIMKSMDELKSAETEFLENRIHLDWYSTEEALMVGGQSVTPMVKVRDLGVFIERWYWKLTWAIQYVAACSMYQLRQLRSVQRSLTLDSWCAHATAFVASRIDYCNGVLIGVAKGEAATSNGFERCCETLRWYGEDQPCHSYPLWCPPLGSL